MHNETKIPRFPIKVLAFALVLTGAVVAWSGWNVYHSYGETKDVLERNIRLEKLRDTIVHLDSVLSMSARIAASSGKMEWEERYLEFARELDDAIKEARTLSPDAYSAAAAAQTAEANMKLVDMEKRSFELARAGRLTEAQKLLASEEYDSQKRIYAQGMTRFASGLADKASATLAAEEVKARRHNAVIIIVAAGLLIGWLAALKMIRRWRTSLVEKNRRLIDEINERHTVEKALVSSEKIYRDLVTSAPVGIYQTNLKGDLLFANEALARIFGFGSTKEMLSTKVAEMYKNPEERKIFIETLRKTGEIIDYEIEVVTKTGKPGYVLASATITGEVLSGMIMDITARKIADAALRSAIARAEDEKARSEAILAGIGDGISIQGTDYKILYQNRIHKEMFGGRVGESCLGTYETDSSQGCCAVVMCFNDGKIHKDERKVAKDGKTRHYEITTAPLKDASGKITSGVEVVRDVTTRKEAEEQLRNHSHDIGELVKELNCLYGASRLMAEQDLTPEEVFDGIVRLIPGSMQYPEITSTRITYEQRTFKTPNFNETPWMLSADIVVGGEKSGGGARKLPRREAREGRGAIQGPGERAPRRARKGTRGIHRAQDSRGETQTPHTRPRRARKGP